MNVGTEERACRLGGAGVVLHLFGARLERLALSEDPQAEGAEHQEHDCFFGDAGHQFGGDDCCDHKNSDHGDGDVLG